MNLQNVGQMKAFARERVALAKDQKRIVAIYAGLIFLIAAAAALGEYLLSLEIAKTGGLGNMGQRSILSAIQTMLPMIQSTVTMCLNLGYLAAMLRIARGQYASPQTLRLGFDRFWTLLRLVIWESLIMLGIGMATIYLASVIFVMTPLSQEAKTILMPLVMAGNVDPNALMDESLYASLMNSMMPAVWIFLGLFLIATAFIMYRYRLAEYVIIDKPGLGAMAALRESRKMMRGNCRKMLRLDFSLWWYYGLTVLIMAVGYADQILPMLGVNLSLSADAQYYLCYGAYQVLMMALYIALRNPVETAYALAYDSLRPKEPETTGVVLGNIFQM